MDELKGLVTVSDVLVQIMQRPSERSIHDIIESCLKEPLLIPESITLMKLLNVLRTEGVHETIVLDEYGGFSGLVTLHDIMEEIVGLMPSGEEEIMEEENKIVEREDGSWLVDGLLDVDEFKEFFHIDEELPGEEKDLYKTMGGLLNVLFGRFIGIWCGTHDWLNRKPRMGNAWYHSFDQHVLHGGGDGSGNVGHQAWSFHFLDLVVAATRL